MTALIIICIVFGLLQKLYHETWLNPGSVFCFLWGALFFLYKLNLFDYNLISERTTMVFYLQIIFFSLGSYLERYVPRIKKRDRKQENKFNAIIVFYILSIITIVFLFFSSILVIKSVLLNGYSFWESKQNGDVLENSYTGFALILQFYVVSPFTLIISPLSAAMIFSDQYNINKRTIFIINLIIVFLHTMQHGGRNVLIIFLTVYIIAYFLHEHRIMTISFKKFAIYIIGFFAIYFFLQITSMRGINNFWESQYFYFVGSIPHLDALINPIKSQDYTFGGVSFYGIIHFFTFLLKGFGIISGNSPGLLKIESVLHAADATVYISMTKTMVAHVGISYAFFNDLGFIGVGIGNFVYAIYCTRAFRLARKNFDIYYVAEYLFLMYTIAMSFIRFYFVNTSVVLGIIYLMVLLKYNKVEKLNSVPCTNAIIQANAKSASR